MSAALDIMGLIAPAAPVPPPGTGTGDAPDRGFRALLDARMAADGAGPSGEARPGDGAGKGLRLVATEGGPGAPGKTADAVPAGLALGRPGGLGDLAGPIDPEVVADLRDRLARGEDIGAEGLGLLLAAAAAERGAVGQAALLSGGAGTPGAGAIDAATGTAAGQAAGAPGATGTAAGTAAADGLLPDDLAQALGRAGTAAGEAAPADGDALPTDAELAARAEAEARAAADPRARTPGLGADLPDGAEAALARQLAEGRPGAAARTAEGVDPNGAGLGLRVAGAEGGMAGFGDGGFGQGGFGQGGFGQSGAGQPGLGDGLAAAGPTGAERAAAAGSFAGMVQVARGGMAAQAVIEQVSVAISRAGGADGADRVTVQLKPASLGSIEVQLEVADDGRVQAHVVADKAETLDLLKNDARALARALAEAGLQTDSGSLNFSLKGDGQQQADGGGNGGTGTGPGLDGDDAAADAAPALTETWTVADDRLDIRV